MSRRETLLNTITYIAFTGLEYIRKYMHILQGAMTTI